MPTLMSRGHTIFSTNDSVGAVSTAVPRAERTAVALGWTANADTKTRVTTAAAATGALAVVVFAITSWVDYRDTRERAWAEADATAQVLEEQILRTVENGRLIGMHVADVVRRDGTAEHYAPVSLMTLIDSPVFAGRWFRRFALDDRPPVDGWQADGRAAITWRHLLQMGSGLEWAENFGTYGSTAQMLWMEPDQGAYAASQPLATAPGSTFVYSTGNFSALPLAMRRRQAQAMRAIEGSAPILSPRGFEPSSSVISDGVFNRLRAMLGY